MKPSSAKKPRKPVDAVTAKNAALINQCATPGLGSLMGRRWIAGSGQLALAVTGFVMVVVWFVEMMLQYYGQITGNVRVHPVGWIGETGGILFAASWLWALVTSFSLFSEARRNATAEFLKKNESTGGSVPPKI
jgi:hypothetical protein